VLARRMRLMAVRGPRPRSTHWVLAVQLGNRRRGRPRGRGVVRIALIPKPRVARSSPVSRFQESSALSRCYAAGSFRSGGWLYILRSDQIS
jgi:hypothetical protein